MKLALAGIFLMLTTALAGAGASTYEFSFDQNALQKSGDQYGDLLKLKGCNMSGLPGDPFMPSKSGQLGAPFGSQIIDIKVIDESWVLLDGNYDIRPAPTPVPFSYSGPMPEIVRNSEIYSSDKPYPAEAFVFTGGGNMRGYAMGGFTVYPLRYYPHSGQVEFLQKMIVEIEYASAQSRFSPAPEFGAVASFMVENPAEITDMPSILSPVDPNDVKYLIITSSSLVSSFQPLADWYTLSGWPAEIVAYTYIQSNYSGASNQLKVKACIKDYADNKGTIYVLLGGDDTIIPDQNCWGAVNSGSTTDNTIPTDLFYACHDNTFNWNSDSDSRVGESVDGIDLYPEVFLSRAPVRTSSHAVNFVDKTLDYIKNHPASGFNDPMLLSGVELWNTWSSRSDADWRCEKMWNDYISPNWSGHSRVRFYDTNTDFGGSGHDVTVSNLSAKFNSGYHYFFMATHGSQTVWGMEGGGGFYSSNALALTNSNEQGVIYTMACITNAFDIEGGFTSDPCLSEGFIRNGNGGAVVYQGSSRYGWGWSNQSDNHGPSFQYADEFYTYLFSGASHSQVPSGYPYKMGAVAASHKAAKASICYSEDDSDAVMRWLTYSLNSIGDPGIDLFTESPSTMNPSYDNSVSIGNSNFTVSNLPSNARVCLWKNSEVYKVGTESSGSVTLPINPTSTGVMKVTATAHNYWPDIDSVNVVDISGPYVVYDSHDINDASGNNNGLINNGESILMGMQLINIGLDDGYNISAVLSSNDSYINITDSTESYGTILGNDGTDYNADAFAFTVDSNVPDNHTIYFDVTVTGNARDVWESDFSDTAHAPVVQYYSVTVDDASGNSNNRLDPDETANLVVTLQNNGSALAGSVIGTLSESDSHISISDDYGVYGDISASGGTANNSANVYTVTADSSCPNGCQMTFGIAVSANNGYSANLNFDLTIGGKTIIYQDDFSTDQGWSGLGGNGEWTIGPATGGVGDDGYGGPDPSTDHSPSSDNQVLGNDLGSGTGGDYNASLTSTYWATSPIINCADYYNVDFDFYRWLGIESDNYDNVYLQVYNGTSWIALFDNGSATIDESSWNLQEHDISLYADRNSAFQIRYGIGTTDGSWQYCGWNIDDIIIDGYYDPINPDPEISISPSDINDSLSPGHISYHLLTVYNYGVGTLNVTLSTSQSWLDFNGGPYNIEYNDHVNINVTLDADGLAPGIHNGEIDFTCNDPVTPSGSIPVTLFVYNPEIDADPLSVTDTLREGDMHTKYIILENTGAGVLDYSVSFETYVLFGLDNGFQSIENNGAKLNSIKNANENTNKNEKNILSPEDGLTLDITDNWLNVVPPSGSLNAGETDTLEITLDASSETAGTYTGNIAVSSNDYDTPDIDIPVTIVVTELPYPDLELLPTSVHDTLSPGEQTVRYLTIYNHGDTTLSIEFNTAETWLELADSQFYVEPSDSALLEITLDAAGLSLGQHMGAIDYISNDPDIPANYVLVFLYVGLPEISFLPASVLDSLYIDSLALHDIVIYNTGGIMLNVDFTSAESWLEFNGGPYNIDAQDSAILALTINASSLSAGDYIGYVDFTSNDPNTPSGNIAANLHVYNPDVYAYPASISDTLLTGESITRYIYLENMGDGMLVYSAYSETFSLVSGNGIEKQANADASIMNVPVNQNRKTSKNLDGSGNDIALDITDEWLSVLPAGGSILAGEIDTLEVMLDASSEIPGTYSGQAAITSNDYDTPIVNIPVSLVVEDATIPNIELNTDAIYDTVLVSSFTDFELIISNIGTADLDFNLDDDQPWIFAIPEAGNVPASQADTVIIRLDALLLAEGNYSSAITVNSNDPFDSQIILPIELNVIGIPEIELSAYSFSAAVMPGSTQVRELIITNNGSGALEYSLFDDQSWLTEYPDTGSIASEGAPDTAAIIFDALLLEQGSYYGQLTVISNEPVDSIINIDITLHVTGDGLAYLPGDINMYNGIWPPAVLGADAIYLVNYFRGVETSPACFLNGFWASADANGDCAVIGSDVTRLVNYFKGNGIIEYCPEQVPMWLTTDDLPAEAPPNWPECESAVLFNDGK